MKFPKARKKFSTAEKSLMAVSRVVEVWGGGRWQRAELTPARTVRTDWYGQQAACAVITATGDLSPVFPGQVRAHRAETQQ